MGRKSSRYESPNRLRVRKNRRVKMHYRVCLASGEEFDASAPDSPLELVCGLTILCKAPRTVQRLQRLLFSLFTFFRLAS